MLREALATAWAAKVPSTLVTFLVATMCAATLATVGRTAAAEEQLLSRLDSAGSRVLVVSDARGDELISPTIVDQTAGLSTTERAIGTIIPVDVVNGAVGQGATRVPAWGVHGDLADVATLTSGRWPGPGEAIVTETAMDRLGMQQEFEHIEPETLGVFGCIERGRVFAGARHAKVIRGAAHCNNQLAVREAALGQQFFALCRVHRPHR